MNTGPIWLLHGFDTQLIQHPQLLGIEPPRAGGCSNLNTCWRLYRVNSYRRFAEPDRICLSDRVVYVKRDIPQIWDFLSGL